MQTPHDKPTYNIPYNSRNGVLLVFEQMELIINVLIKVLLGRSVSVA